MVTEPAAAPAAKGTEEAVTIATGHPLDMGVIPARKGTTFVVPPAGLEPVRTADAFSGDVYRGPVVAFSDFHTPSSGVLEPGRVVREVTDCEVAEIRFTTSL